MDRDALELAQRRLVEEVRAKVERDLFRYYRNVGSAIVVVLGTVGVTVGWPAFRGMVEDEIERQVSDPVAEARQTAEAARVLARERLGEIDARQARLLEDIGRVGPRLDDLRVALGRSAEEAERARRAVDGLEGSLADVRELVDFLRRQAQVEPVTREELAALEAGLATVAGRTADLAAAVAALSPGVSPATDVAGDLAALSREQQAKATDRETMAAQNPRQGRLVYVQFTGGSRADMRAALERLRALGWTLPGEEQLATAAGLSEIRYFHDQDAAAAALLAREVTEALAAIGLGRVPVTARKVSWSPMPAPGVIELWIEIPQRG
jgi:hypothetical protein